MAVYLIDTIKQYNNGTFKLMDSNDISGGMFHVDTKSEMDNIPQDRYRYGMLCFVADESKFYQWLHIQEIDDSTGVPSITEYDEWREFKPGFDVNESIDELGGRSFIEYVQSVVENNVCTVDEILYTVEGQGDINNVKDALDKLCDTVFYVKVNINTFTSNPSGGIFEMGTTISQPITFNWTTNKTIESQSMNNGIIVTDPSERSATYQQDITTDKTFTLTIRDDRNTVNKSITYTFLNGIYYGVGEARASFDSLFIRTLTKKLTNSPKTTFTVNAGVGQYVIFAYPKRMGNVSFKVGGFEGGFNNMGDIAFNNASGYTETYTIYQSTNANLGNITVEVV